MERFRTEQERVDSMTVRIENPNVVGSGFIRHPPQRPQQKKQQQYRPHASHQHYQYSDNYGGGGYTNPRGPPPPQNYPHSRMAPGMLPQRMPARNSHPPPPHHHLPPPPPYPPARGMHPGNFQTAPGYMPGAPSGMMNGHSRMGGGHHAMGGNMGGPDMGRGRPLYPGPMPGMVYGAESSRMQQQSMPQMGGYMQNGGGGGMYGGVGGYSEDGVGSDGFMARRMMSPNVPVMHPQQQRPMGGYVSPQALAQALAPQPMSYSMPQMENGHQQHTVQPIQPPPPPPRPIQTPQVPVSCPDDSIQDGSRSPTINYQPPPPHKAPAPIGTPLPGSLSKTPPPSSKPPQAWPQPASRVQTSPPSRKSSPPTSTTQEAYTQNISSVDRLANDLATGMTLNDTEKSEEGVVGEDVSQLKSDKEGLSKRQKTRLRKKMREMHLKEKNKPKGVA